MKYATYKTTLVKMVKARFISRTVDIGYFLYEVLTLTMADFVRHVLV